jgi:nitrite reductase (NADH) large subunit
MSEPLVIVGNGMAAAKLCDELSRLALGRYAVAVIGEEPRPAYNRVLLSSLLADEIEASDLELKPATWWRDRGVTQLHARRVTRIDRPTRSVTLEDGTTLPYAKLVIATGSKPIALPLPGMDLPGVLTFRNLGDVDAIRAAALPGSRAVVIGGGLLGLEAAYGLAKSGTAVTLVHLMDRLMERQLDAPAAALLQRAVEAHGITVLLEAETERVLGTERAASVGLKDGRTLDADFVVVAVGIHPNADLARDAGLAVKRGIVVDDGLRTSDPDIFAIGECAEHHGQCYGLVEPVYEQARVLASRLTERGSAYEGSVLATNLKVSGVSLFSAGDFLGSPGTEEIVLTGFGTYKKLVVAEERLVGAVLFGDTADALWYLDLIRSGRSIANLRNDLAFGRPPAQQSAA